MNRAVAGTRVPRKEPAPRRPFRTLLRFFGWILFVLSLPPLAWFIYNRIDESPSSDARRWENVPRREVKDADNAWLYLYGIGAAENDDPIALGRRRVDLYVERQRKDPQGKVGPDLGNDSDPVPQVKPDEKVDGIKELCAFRDVECIAWAQQHAQALQRLASANRLRLQRFDKLLDMPQWQDAPLLGDYLLPDVSIAALQANLLALEGNVPSRIPQVAADVARVAAFWRRPAEQAETLFSKVVAFAYIQRCQFLVVELLRRATPAQRSAMAASVDSVLAPPSAAALDLDVAAWENFQSLSHLMRYQMPSPWGTVRNCWNGKVQNGSCLKDFLMSAAFAPQSTVNIVGRLDSALADFLAAKPEDAAQAKQDYQERVERENPLREGNATSLLAYNLTGKTLAFIGIPKADWRWRLNDYEALRRMLVIKATAIRDNIPAARMADFVAGQPVYLRNPYGGKAFDWDGKAKAMQYTASSKDSFKRDSIAVSYP